MRITGTAFLTMLMAASALACSSPTVTPTASATPPGPTVTPTAEHPFGEGTYFPPQVGLGRTEATAGTTLAISGSGGYVERPDGLYDESSRDFVVYFDGAAAGSLNCYVNRCEGDVAIPAEATEGEHEVRVEHGPTLPLMVTRPAIPESAPLR